jgi:hypothetical protein
MFHKYHSNTERIMNIKNILFCFCLLTLVFLLSSCEKDLNIEIKTNDKRLLVDGEFTNDTVVHSIRLYCSGGLITGRPQTIVSGAKIYVTDGTETFDYIENKDTLGLYQTVGKVGGIGGHIYTLNISNVDIDGDEKYTAQTMMPVPVRFDSMVSYYSMNGDNIEGTVRNSGYYTTFYNGPDYLYYYVIVKNKSFTSITDELGSGYLTSREFQYKTEKINTPGLVANGRVNYWVEPQMSVINEGDIICIFGLNFNKDQYEFLKKFDNNTTATSDNLFNIENIYDQLKIPTNLPTNIEPSDKAAGYFFIYSVSKISKVFIK